MATEPAPRPGEDDVRRLCLALPGVTERPSWGQPSWFARTLMARIWEPGVVTVKTVERGALHAGDPETFFWTAHHDRSPQLVLVRLDRVDLVELEELLGESYRLAGAPRPRRSDLRRSDLRRSDLRRSDEGGTT